MGKAHSLFSPKQGNAPVKTGGSLRRKARGKSIEVGAEKAFI